MVKTKSGWSGTNTDLTGLSNVLSTIEMPPSVAVWGGGGTRLVLKSLLPKAHFFSARMGREIWNEGEQKSVSPELVFWALGRSRMEGSVLPPKEWQPHYVVDLNYAEDSPGRDYALNTGAKYISGRAFFKAQAQGQREFWSQEIKS
jgi:shikimate 5-dehydrogenase